MNYLQPKIFIFSQESVFVALLTKLLNNNIDNIVFKTYKNLVELNKEIDFVIPDIIVFDNSIKENNCNDIIDFFRNEKKINSPIIYFYNQNIENNNILYQNANYLIKKPFVPEIEIPQIIEVIISNINTSFVNQ